MNAIQNCGTCQHWDNSGNGNVADPPEGQGTCDLIGDSEYRKGAIARTAFGYDLYTSADFGCVLHEPRKES